MKRKYEGALRFVLKYHDAKRYRFQTQYGNKVVTKPRTTFFAADIVFLNCRPAIPANVLTERFSTNRFKDLPGEVAIDANKETNAFCHGEKSFDQQNVA